MGRATPTHPGARKEGIKATKLTSSSLLGASVEAALKATGAAWGATTAVCAPKGFLPTAGRCGSAYGCVIRRPGQDTSHWRASAGVPVPNRHTHQQRNWREQKARKETITVPPPHPACPRRHLLPTHGFNLSPAPPAYFRPSWERRCPFLKVRWTNSRIDDGFFFCFFFSVFFFFFTLLQYFFWFDFSFCPSNEFERLR